jgi:hypothetical protein
MAGKYFFLALHKSCLKMSLKISKQRKLLAGIPLKITSFLIVHRLQHMIIIISIKKLTLICTLELSNLCRGSGELLTVKPIRLQQVLARSHSRKR